MDLVDRVERTGDLATTADLRLCSLRSGPGWDSSGPPWPSVLDLQSSVPVASSTIGCQSHEADSNSASLPAKATRVPVGPRSVERLSSPAWGNSSSLVLIVRRDSGSGLSRREEWLLSSAS